MLKTFSLIVSLFFVGRLKVQEEVDAPLEEAAVPQMRIPMRRSRAFGVGLTSGLRVEMSNLVKSAEAAECWKMV